MQHYTLLKVFRVFPSFVAAALGIAHPSPATPAIVNVDMDIEDKDGNTPVAGTSPVMCSIYVVAAKYLLLFPYSMYISVAFPVRKHQTSGTVTCSPRNRSLETTTFASTVIGKEEDVLDRTEATESLTLRAEALAPEEVLPEAMKAVCCRYDDDFRGLHETHELQSGEDLTESVYLLLRDLFFNVRRREDLSNSRHDLFSAVDMDNLCVFVQKLLMLGGHGHIFSSAIQFTSWWWRLCTLTEDVDGFGRKRKCLRQSRHHCFTVVSRAVIHNIHC